MTEMAQPHDLFLSYHSPLSHEPGALRSCMTARLLKQAGFPPTVMTSAGDDRALVEAIRQLHHDKSLRQKMGASGKHWFVIHISFDQACSLIKKVMDHNDIPQT